MQPQLAASLIRHRQLEFCHSSMGAKELLRAPHMVLEHLRHHLINRSAGDELEVILRIGLPGKHHAIVIRQPDQSPCGFDAGGLAADAFGLEESARSIFRCSVWTWRRRLPPRPYMIARSTLPTTSTAKLTAAAATNDRSILSIVTTPSRRAAFSPWRRRARTMSRICLAEIVRAGV
jgi:hypothetical protein